MWISNKGKVAVVTGAGSGIGRAIAVRLARDEAAIAVWDINAEGAAETARMITDAGGKAIAIGVDCSDKAAITAAAQRTRAELGSITILVNNAGIAPFTPFMDIGEELFDNHPEFVDVVGVEGGVNGRDGGVVTAIAGNY